VGAGPICCDQENARIEYSFTELKTAQGNIGKEGYNKREIGKFGGDSNQPHPGT